MTQVRSPPIATPVESDVDAASDETVMQVVANGPSGAFAVAGIATGIVLALYFVFYAFAYLPRGVVQ